MTPSTNPAYTQDLEQLSPWNFSNEVLGDKQVKPKVVLCDATIREGEQGSIIGFTEEQKMEYVRRAANAGVELVQLTVDRDHDALVRMMSFIHEEQLPIKTESLSMAPQFDTEGQKRTYDELLSLGIDYIDVMGLITPYAEPMFQGAPVQAFIADAAAQIAYITSQGGHASYDPMDGPRMDFDVLMEAYQTAVDAGAERIRILDSNGTASPATWRHLVRTVRARFPATTLCVHCHNDFGQAMANVYASVEEGADMVDVCANGLGERAGNASLQEVAAGLTMLYDVDTNIELAQLCELADYASLIAKRPVPMNAPIVGRWAFAHGDDGHYMLNQIAPGVFQATIAETYGNVHPVLFGTSSGPATTGALLAKLGYAQVEQQKLAAITGRLSAELAARREVLEDAFVRAIADEIL